MERRFATPMGRAGGPTRLLLIMGPCSTDWEGRDQERDVEINLSDIERFANLKPTAIRAECMSARIGAGVDARGGRKLRYWPQERLAPKSCFTMFAIRGSIGCLIGCRRVTSAILMGHRDPSAISRVYQHLIKALTTYGAPLYVPAADRECASARGGAALLGRLFNFNRRAAKVFVDRFLGNADSASSHSDAEVLQQLTRT